MMKYNIDISRLKRNYLENPLTISKSIKLNERPFKEDLEYLYIELNIPRKEVCSLFNWNINSFDGWIKYYGIHKSRNLTIQNMYKTNIEKYGCKNTFGNERIKEKIKQTNLKKYGVSKYINTEKIKQTNLKKYGVEYYTQTDEYKNKEALRKSKLTELEKNNISKNKRIIQFKNKDSIFQNRIDIISNREQMIKCIIENGLHNTTSLMKYFGINRSNINNIIRKYNIRYLMTDITSDDENSIISYISKYYNIELHNRTILDGKEIDIFIPEKNIGIEFNGNFWHCEYHKDKLYHQNKSLLAESKGIFLYHIFEYEWINNKDRIINQLNNLLGLNQTKIYARKCIIKEVDNKEKSQFLELNHMQGNDSSSIKFGLYYNDELVSIMTFCKPRFNKKYEWELSRFCSKAGCNVIGGASKLWTYFISNYKPSSVISYSNNAHTKGKLYKTLGMTLQGISEPNYVWFKKDSVLTRYQCQKHKLLEQGYQGNSEVDIMHNRKYYRIYDCGNKVWVWNNK